MPQTKKQAGKGLTPQQKKQVKELVKAPMERKTIPLYQQGTSVTTTHTFYSISEVAQGDTVHNRDGNEISISSMSMKGVVVGADATNIVRMILIRWKPATTPVIADILEATTVGTDGGMFSPLEQKRRSDFVLLADKYVYTDTYNNIKPFNLTIGHQPKITFADSSTAGTNKLYLILFSDSGSVSHPAITYRGQIYFYDS